MDKFLFVTECARVSFDNRDLALAFLQMLAHQISVEQWLDVVRRLVTDPDGLAMAKSVAVACVGQGA